MTWAHRRKLIYISGIIIFILVFIVLPIAWSLYQAPTCFDNKQNQDELGVDCGGVCNLLCPSQYISLNVLWSRFSKVGDGVYNVLAYVENPNIGASANNLSYAFKLYDNKGILLKERAGRTFVPPGATVAIFEPDMQTGNLVPQRVEFSFTSNAVWTKENRAENNLSISKAVISREDSAPRLSATVLNKSIDQIKNIEAVAIIYNAEGNTITFSRTTIDSILGKESADINFNWPKPFADTYARNEILLKVLK
jgi:hypothetical protein